MLKNKLIGFFITLISTCNWAQISPPGLGKAKTADWLAIGIRQDIDSLKKWQSMSYIGMGRISNPDNNNPFFKPAILVVNQEFYHQLHKNWQYSLALSYRKQDDYLESAPYEHSSFYFKQELRFYTRFSYIFKTDGLKFTPTLRQEFRTFYHPDFSFADEAFQYRARLRLQLAINLTQRNNHKLILSTEQLFSISKETNPNSWSEFNYRESRFCLYYSWSPESLPFVFNLGYMNNLVGNKSTYDVHYIAFDIILENPFNLKRNK